MRPRAVSGGDVRAALVYGIALVLLAAFAARGVRGLRRAEAAG